MDNEPGRTRSRVPYVAIAMAAGVAFAIVALLNAPGIAFAIVAVVAALCYSVVAMANRRRG